jgi:hypothetical protein
MVLGRDSTDRTNMIDCKAQKISTLSKIQILSNFTGREFFIHVCQSGNFCDLQSKVCNFCCKTSILGRSLTDRTKFMFVKIFIAYNQMYFSDLLSHAPKLEAFQQNSYTPISKPENFHSANQAKLIPLSQSNF